MTAKKYRKFVANATKYLIRKRQFFRRMNKNVSMRRVVNDLEQRQQILQSLHDQSEHREKEKIYHKIAIRYY